MFVKLLILTGLVSSGLLLFIMTLYDPSSVGALGILIVFLLGYVIILCALTIFLWTLVLLSSRVRGVKGILRNIQQLTIREVYYYSSVLALAPVIIISLRSVGQVTFYEIGLILLFEVLGCLYIAKRAK
mgnify:CR=1 FL=1